MTLFTIGVLVTSLVITCHALDYTDLENLGIACPLQDSCRQVGSTNFTDRNCECDRYCAAFQDCCIDAPVPLGPRRYRNKRLHCMAFGNDMNVGAYVVDNCPRTYIASANVRNKCQEEDDFVDPLVSAPVTDPSTSRTFRNRYCAECNNVDPHSLQSWLIYINCESLAAFQVNETFVWQNIKYNINLNSWGVRIGKDFHECKLVFDKPDYLEGVRLCRANVTSSCPDSWRRLTVKRSCESYMAVVYDTDNAYQNVHCAICNGQLVSRLSCEKPWIMTRRRNKPFSFALLLDVNRGDGDIVGISQRCPNAQKYDPFFKKCRPLVCALPGYTMVNGKCKKV